MKRVLAFTLLLAFTLTACKAKVAVTPFQEITPMPQTPVPIVYETPVPTPKAAQSAAPVVTPSPEPQTATLGFVGDIMVMSGQISGAKTASGYDFSKSFAQMSAAFSSVSFLCGNFECTFAGAKAGYTLPKATAAPATEVNPTPKAPNQRFNAPDELAANLRLAGFDLLSTSNNHCLDFGGEGLSRTAQVIRAAGMMQLGTYMDEQDAKTPRVADINGIKVGFVAAASYINSGSSLSASERAYAVTMLDSMPAIEGQITACRDAGAAFVILLVHWGDEHGSAQGKRQEQLAYALIAAGADAIIGSHPHVAQPMLWLDAERDGKTVRVPVVYSLGNFISTMPQKNCDYGVFARLTLTRSVSGEVSCSALAYLPLLCYRDSVQMVKPCFFDEAGESRSAWTHVRAVCGADGIDIITRGELTHAGKTAIDQSAQ